MGFDRIRIKENAKRHYEINKWQNVLVALVVTLISGGVQVVLRITEASAFLVLFASLISLALTICVVNVVSMGANTWYHRAIKTEGLKWDEMFWTFKEDYSGNLLMMFLISLYSVLWSLLFIIPGIVKAYSYSLAMYIKSENTNISASNAIDLSKRITDGHKMDLFVLDLSFWGWLFLSALTLNVLGILYVQPYYLAARAFAYEEIKEDALARNIVTEAELYGYGA